MEGILAIVAIYGGLALIGWFFGQVGKWNDERKSRIRDEVAQSILPSTIIKEELIDDYKNKLKEIGFDENQKYNWISSYYHNREKKSYRGLLGKCPECSEGYLRVIDGKYGKFIGCSKYPNCKFTKNLDKAKAEYKDKSNKEFFELFHLAYQ
jgi:hypothetical protein